GQRVVPVLRRGQLDDDHAAALAGDAADTDALALEIRLQILGGAVRLAGDGLFGLDPENEMDAALQVEAEVDRLLRRIHVPEGADDDGGDEGDPDPDPSRHLSPP